MRATSSTPMRPPQVETTETQPSVFNKIEKYPLYRFFYIVHAGIIWLGKFHFLQGRFKDWQQTLPVLKIEYDPVKNSELSKSLFLSFLGLHNLVEGLEAFLGSTFNLSNFFKSLDPSQWLKKYTEHTLDVIEFSNCLRAETAVSSTNETGNPILFADESKQQRSVSFGNHSISDLANQSDQDDDSPRKKKYIEEETYEQIKSKRKKYFYNLFKPLENFFARPAINTSLKALLLAFTGIIFTAVFFSKIGKFYKELQKLHSWSTTAPEGIKARLKSFYEFSGLYFKLVFRASKFLAMSPLFKSPMKPSAQNNNSNSYQNKSNIEQRIDAFGGNLIKGIFLGYRLNEFCTGILTSRQSGPIFKALRSASLNALKTSRQLSWHSFSRFALLDIASNPKNVYYKFISSGFKSADHINKIADAFSILTENTPNLSKALDLRLKIINHGYQTFRASKSYEWFLDQHYAPLMVIRPYLPDRRLMPPAALDVNSSSSNDLHTMRHTASLGSLSLGSFSLGSSTNDS